ncbi:MAG: hypothetical protein Q27BPR15_17020 [Rhodobacter sp. CACIA14H1]|nr:MAG: hypothetical protein Q27BPR15_17020 [Rhodobacter sp. CACIA14H1]
MHLCSITEIAHLLRFSVRTIQRRTAAGDLPVQRVAGTPVFDLDAVADKLGLPTLSLMEGLLTGDEFMAFHAKGMVAAHDYEIVSVFGCDRLVREGSRATTKPWPT